MAVINIFRFGNDNELSKIFDTLNIVNWVMISQYRKDMRFFRGEFPFVNTRALIQNKDAILLV